jgi:amidase
VVGIKPTVGLTSRAGVVPISHTQDTIGPHGRTVADAAVTLGVMQSRTFDGRDPATAGVPLGWRKRFPRPQPGDMPGEIPSDYTKFLNPDGLRGARLGVTRQGIDAAPQPVIDKFEAVLAALRNAGATVIELDGPNASISPAFTFPPAFGELLVLEFDFRDDLKSYFATRVGVPMAGKQLADAIDFNNAHRKAEMPFWGQELFVSANGLFPGADTLQTDPILNLPAPTSYNGALDADQDATVKGLDKALSQFHLDAVVAPTDNPAWSTDLLYGDHFVFGSSGLGAPGGYPYVQVPATNVFGIPMGITFFGTAFSEGRLIALASGFEAVTHERANNLPKFTPTIPDDHIAGEPLKIPRGKSEKPDGWRPRHM